MGLIYLINSSKDDEVLFSHDGAISQEFITEISSIIEVTLNKHDIEMKDKVKIMRNLFGVAVEQLQNIMSYSKDSRQKNKSARESDGICMLGYFTNKEKYFIKTLNHIETEDKDRLIEKIDKINSMDKIAQRKYLRQLLRSGENTHSRGAGLGFLEIAKRSSEKINYEFKDTPDGLYFELTISV